MPWGCLCRPFLCLFRPLQALLFLSLSHYVFYALGLSLQTFFVVISAPFGFSFTFFTYLFLLCFGVFFFVFFLLYPSIVSEGQGLISSVLPRFLMRSTQNAGSVPNKKKESQEPVAKHPKISSKTPGELSFFDFFGTLPSIWKVRD